MYKRTIVIIIALATVLFLLTACGGAGTQAVTTQSESTAAATTTAAAAETAANETATARSDEMGTQANPAADGTIDPKYEKHLSFTIASLDYPDGFDDYPLVTEAKNLFNMDFKVQQVAWDTWDETIRTFAATNTLPEVVAWYNLNFAEYRMWAEQGVFLPFPDDMTVWPHLKDNLDQLAVVPYLMVDGKLYCNPKINNNQPVNHFINDMTKIRRDWALALGYDWYYSQEVSFEDFIQFLKDVRDQDPGEVGESLIPCDPDGSGQGWVNMARWWNGNLTEYYKDANGKYEWGARDPANIEAINTLNMMYKEGLLYRDGYADFVAVERFSAGRVAAQYGALAVHELTSNANTLKDNFPDFKDEDLGSIAIRMPDGKYHHKQMNQYWAAFAFSNNCSQEIMESWLDCGNWLMEEEQVEKYAYGVPGEDWTKDANGNVTVNWAAEDLIRGASKYYIAGQRMFQKFYMLEGADLWLPGNPALRPILQENIYLDFFRNLGAAEARGEVEFTPIDFEIQFVEGPNKDQYGSMSTPIQDAIMQAVVSDDPITVWNDFLTESAPIVDSVLDEINAALAN